MDLSEIVAEMHRRPDAQFLLEWLDEHLPDSDQNAPARIAISAYFEGVEES